MKRIEKRIIRRTALILSAHQVSKLRRIIVLAEKLIASSPPPKRGRPPKTTSSGVEYSRKNAKRIRRSGDELVRFRKMLKAQRREGVPVAELARKNKVSAAYIYMIP